LWLRPSQYFASNRTITPFSATRSWKNGNNCPTKVADACNPCPDVQDSKSTYAGINIQHTKYSGSIDENLPLGKTGHMPKRSGLLASANGRTSHRVRLAAAPGPFGNNQKPKEKPMTKMFSTMTVYGLLMISAAYAQSGQPIQAKVPFAFMAQNTILAPGTYQLRYSASAHRLSIRGLDQNSEGAFATAIPATGSASRDESGKLVFQCYDKTCYLAQVWQGSIGVGRGLSVRHPEPPRKLTLTTRAVSITIPAK
jgi:hypothetical protein